MKGIQRYYELHAHIKMERERAEAPKELEELLRKNIGKPTRKKYSSNRG